MDLWGNAKKRNKITGSGTEFVLLPDFICGAKETLNSPLPAAPKMQRRWRLQH